MEWIFIGYMWLFIHRPLPISPSRGDIHIERVYALYALCAVLAYPRKRWIDNAQHLAFFGFWVAVLMCWLSSPWTAQGQQGVEDYFKIVFFYILFTLVVHDERALQRL